MAGDLSIKPIESDVGRTPGLETRDRLLDDIVRNEQSHGVGEDARTKKFEIQASMADSTFKRKEKKSLRYSVAKTDAGKSVAKADQGKTIDPKNPDKRRDPEGVGQARFRDDHPSRQLA